MSFVVLANKLYYFPFLFPAAAAAAGVLRLAIFALSAVTASLANWDASNCVMDIVASLTTSKRLRASKSFSASGSWVFPMRSWTRSICLSRRSYSSISSVVASSNGTLS
jgi:hypothetical protein